MAKKKVPKPIGSDRVEVKFDDREIQSFVRDVIDREQAITKRGKKIIDSFGAVVFRDVIKHFEQERGMDRGWDEWSPSYALQMARQGKAGNKTLQDTGRLRQNFKPSDWERRKDGIIWFNDAVTDGGFPYAFAHDEGGPTLPQREFMWLSDEALNDIAKMSWSKIK